MGSNGFLKALEALEAIVRKLNITIIMIRKHYKYFVSFHFCKYFFCKYLDVIYKNQYIIFIPLQSIMTKIRSLQRSIEDISDSIKYIRMFLISIKIYIYS